jgi:membrane fusion protein (multidrug efflux system)
VGKGALLAKLDDAAFRDAHLSARSGVTSAQTGAGNAARELERAEKLVAAGAIAEREVEQARSANTAAQSALADARARLTIAEDNLQRTEIRAPFDGVVSRRWVSAGDVVQPGGEIYTVVDPSSMRLEAAVPADQLMAIKLGAPVTFTVSGYPDRAFTGRVTRINPAADPVTRQVQIYVSIPNAGSRLVAGLFAEGRVASESHLGLVVPQAAVNERGTSPTVMRIKGGRVKQVAVQLGLRDAATETVEVVAGIAASDTVLLGAAQGIEPNTPVRVQVPSDRAQR